MQMCPVHFAFKVKKSCSSGSEVRHYGLQVNSQYTECIYGHTAYFMQSLFAIGTLRKFPGLMLIDYLIHIIGKPHHFAYDRSVFTVFIGCGYRFICSWYE